MAEQTLSGSRVPGYITFQGVWKGVREALRPLPSRECERVCARLWLSALTSWLCCRKSFSHCATDEHGDNACSREFRKHVLPKFTRPGHKSTETWCIVMARLHWHRRIWIPNPMYCAEHFTMHRLGSQIPIPYFCIGQEFESESVSGSVNQP